jgi:hypothetical protein
MAVQNIPTSSFFSIVCNTTDHAPVFRKTPSSRFLLLPAEIRNQIYAHVFSSFTFAIVRKEMTKPKGQVSNHHKSSNNYDLSLLYVCRQVHRETATLPFMLGTFTITSITASMMVGSNVFTHRQIAAITRLCWKTKASDMYMIAGLSQAMMATPSMALRLMFPGVKSLIWDQPLSSETSMFTSGLPYYPGTKGAETYRDNIEAWATASGEVEFEIRVSDEFIGRF